MDEAIPAPLDTCHRACVARQGEEAAPGVGVPHFCSAVLGGCHEAAAGHLHVGGLPGHGHDHLGVTCMTLTQCQPHVLPQLRGIYRSCESGSVNVQRLLAMAGKALCCTAKICCKAHVCKLRSWTASTLGSANASWSSDSYYLRLLLGAEALIMTPDGVNIFCFYSNRYDTNDSYAHVKCAKQQCCICQFVWR